MPVFIYHLYDHELQQPIYVGATTQPNQRWSNHFSKTLKNYCNRSAVEMQIIDKTSPSLAGYKENKYFKKYNDLGYPLLQIKCKKYPVKWAFG